METFTVVGLQFTVFSTNLNQNNAIAMPKKLIQRGGRIEIKKRRKITNIGFSR